MCLLKRYILFFINVYIAAHLFFNVHKMHIKPIHDNKMGLSRRDLLWDIAPNTEEGDGLAVLTTLTNAFEEQQNLEDNDIVSFLGLCSYVSEVLNRKRGLSITVFRKLNNRSQILLACLPSDYDLEVLN